MLPKAKYFLLKDLESYFKHIIDGKHYCAVIFKHHSSDHYKIS